MSHKKNIAVIGSTGSIGSQTLEIVRSFPDRFKVVALAAGHNKDILECQAREFEPDYLYLHQNQPEIAGSRFLPLEEMVVLPQVDLVVMALSGLAGLKPTLQAIQAGKVIALANKESLVMAGEIIKEQAERSGASVLPVDSEHSAIWQCLKGEQSDIARVILTASGGPFRNYTREMLDKVTPQQALKHPSWQMGPKVTIDSATLLNKGLEVIEAHYLFDISYDQIDVLIHPSSLVHSLVEFVDGSVKAQLGVPDMRTPIQHALSYPERWFNQSLPRIDWANINNLSFEKPDLDAFPCLGLAIEAGRRGATYPAVLCGAGQACVDMFLASKIRFTRIDEIIKRLLDEHQPIENADIDLIENTANDSYNKVVNICRE